MAGEQLVGKKRRVSDADAPSTSRGGAASGAEGRSAKKPRASTSHLLNGNTNGSSSSKKKAAQNTNGNRGDPAAAAATSTSTAIAADGDNDDGALNAAAADASSSSLKLTPAAALAGLRTSSLDALRIILTDIRSLTSLSAAEQGDLLPPTDARQVFASALVKGAGDESLHTAKPIFDAWDLAEQRGAHTLIPVIQNVLTNLLRLLSMHSPTHPLGDTIIRRIIPARTSAEASGSSESYFNRLQGYIAGTQRPGSSAAGSTGPGKGFSQDAIVISSLRLLAEVVSYAGGNWSREVFDNFNWGLKSLSKLLSLRRRQHTSNKRKASSQQLQAATISRPDTRTAFLIFYLSFLRPLASSASSASPESGATSKSATAAKVALLALPGKDFTTPLLKGLAEDAPSVVAFVLEALHSGLLSDTSIPRSSKLSFFNEWNCAHLLALYQRQWEAVPNVTFSSLNADRPTIAEMTSKRPTVAELTHHFMLSLCTHPGFGICFRDDAWYPRNQHRAGAEALDAKFDDEDVKKSNKADRSAGSSLDGGLYNKVLLGVLRHLVPTRSLPQQELAIRILEACPELVGPYLSSITSSSPAGVVISLEPRSASSAYVTSLAWLNKVFSLPIPTFANTAPSTHRGQKDPSVLDDRIAYRPQAPPLASTLASLLPHPLLSRAVLLRACFHADRLVRHQASTLLAVILDRIRRFNDACKRVSEALGEDLVSLHRPLTLLDERNAGITARPLVKCAWAAQCRDVQQEARKVLPDLDSFVAAIQTFSQQQQQLPTTSSTADAKSTQLNSNSLLLEVNLRVLWLYYVAVPHATFDSTFDVGKLLLSRFMMPSTPSVPVPGLVEAEESEMAELQGERQISQMCQLYALRIVNASAAGFSAESTDFVRNAVGGGLALATSSFDVFTRPSTSNASTSADASANGASPSATVFAGKTYFTALLSIVLSSHSDAVRETCQNLLRSAMTSSVLFQHDRREWDVWMASFPRNDVPVAAADATVSASPDSASLSTDQSIVLTFLDDCLARTLKTPYRYIEASRRFLAESSTAESDEDATLASTPVQLAGSPLLHTMVEQFSIRCRKRILDAGEAPERKERDEERSALLAFFNRFILQLSARGVPSAALRRIAAECTSAAEDEVSRPTQAVIWACKVLRANLDVLERGPPKQATSSKANGKAQQNTQGDFNEQARNAKDVGSLRRLLRAAQRPLGKEQVQIVSNALARLASSGAAAALELPCLLHPTEERIAAPEKVFAQIPEHSDVFLPTLLHATSTDSARLVSAHDELDALPKLLGAVTALARLHAGAGTGTSSNSDKQASSAAEDMEMLEACIRSGVDDDDLRDVIFQLPGVRGLSDGRPNAAGHDTDPQAGVLIALASAMSPSNAVHKSLMSSVAVRVVKQSLGQAKRIDLNTLKPVVLLLPFCDDQTLAAFAKAMLELITKGSSKLAETVLKAAVAAIQRALVLAIDDSVAQAIVTATIGATSNDSKPGSALPSALIDLISHALAVLSPPGILDSAAMPSNTVSKARTSSLQVALDQDRVKNLVTSATEDGSAYEIASFLIQSHSAAAAYFRIAVSHHGDAIASSLSNLYASVAVLLLKHKTSRTFTDIGGLDLQRLASHLSSAIFSEAPERSSTAASIASMLAEAHISFLDSMSSALLQAVPKEHRLAFNRAAIILCTAFAQLQAAQVKDAQVNDTKARTPLLSFCRKLISSGLLWIVRRFAEDPEDSEDLLLTIAAFNRLLEQCPQLKVDIPTAAAEPVIEAGITRRWNELEPMRLIHVLCKHTKLAPAGVTKVVGRLSAVVSTARLSLFADSPATDVDLMHTRIIVALARQNPDQLTALVPLLAASYRGRLSEDDLAILELLQECEAKAGVSTLGAFWSIVCQGDASALASSANPGLDILTSLSASAMLKTCTSFPRWRTLLQHKLAKASAAEQPVFDPLFILLLTNAAVVDPSFKGLDILTLLRTNAVGVAVCALSSRCPLLRSYAAQILARVRVLAHVSTFFPNANGPSSNDLMISLIQMTTFNERGHLLLILDAIRNTDEAGSSVFEPLPLTTSLFLAHALHALANPALFTYPLFTHFLLQRPIVDARDVPMLYNMFSSSTENAAREREWMLRFLRDCMRSGGRLEWRILKRRHVWELLCSAYTSSAKSEARNNTIREFMLAVAELPHAARELLGRRHVLAWINSAIALEQRPRTVGSPFWLRLAATLLDEIPVAEVEHITQGFWSSAVLSVLNQCVPEDAASTLFSVRALQDAARLCSRLIAHWQDSESKVSTALLSTMTRQLNNLVQHASRLLLNSTTGEAEADKSQPSLAIIRSLFQSVLTLQSVSQKQDVAMVRLFTHVLRIALALQLPEARHLAIRHLS
ncbi:hypothetical protein OC834_002320 [Tilletia horrida]|nr:hypothetical protein OC834_002320 [Tilletia horrida]